MIDRSFLEKMEEAFAPKTYEVGGRVYSSGALCLVPEPMPEPVQVHSLTGIVDYVQSDPDGLGDEIRIHVCSHSRVAAYGPLSDPTRQRPCYVVAQYESPLPQSFIGAYSEPETFVIVLQTLFEAAGDRAEVLAVVGNLEAENVTGVSDDGVSQQVSVRAGIVRKGNLIVRNPVLLAPFRTFGEIEQPESPFILRLRGGGEGKLPQAGLFAADGGLWKLEAMERIRQWLTGKLPGKTVIA